jgi:WD40 repeat protein
MGCRDREGPEGFRAPLGIHRLFALSSDGRRVYTGHGYGVGQWSTATGKEEKIFGRHQKYVLSLALSADERCLVTGSKDGEIKLWDTGSGKELRTMAGQFWPVSALAVSLDGEHDRFGAGTASSGCGNGKAGGNCGPSRRTRTP